MPSFTGFLITLCIGVAATLGWQSYGDEARELIASSYPQLGWLAPNAQNAAETVALAAPHAASPDQQQLDAISQDLDAMRQSVDKIATSQEQITRGVDRIVAGQEQMTREITKLQEIEQYVLYKHSESPPPPVPAPARSRPPRPSPAPPTPAPATNP